MKIKLVVTGMAVLGLAVMAQEKKSGVQESVMLYTQASGVAGAMGAGVQVAQFVGGGAVKGAPYAAEATNETIQILQDGNRIVSKNTSKMYRDAEGRTRMENNFSPLGPLVPEGKVPSITSIDDPVSKEHFILDNNRKSATKMGTTKFLPVPDMPGEARGLKMEMRQAAPSGLAAPTTVRGEFHSGGSATVTVDEDLVMDGAPMMMSQPATAVRGFAFAGRGQDVKSESLGKQVIEGVECDGTRETMTIPAGQIGNERPIVSVTERWYSEKLGLEVMRKHTDPRFGETNYKLSQVVLADQPRSLFEIPADYKVEETPGPNVMFNRRPRESKE